MTYRPFARGVQIPLCPGPSPCPARAGCCGSPGPGARRRPRSWASSSGRSGPEPCTPPCSWRRDRRLRGGRREEEGRRRKRKRSGRGVKAFLQQARRKKTANVRHVDAHTHSHIHAHTRPQTASGVFFFHNMYLCIFLMSYSGVAVVRIKDLGESRVRGEQSERRDSSPGVYVRDGNNNTTRWESFT